MNDIRKWVIKNWFLFVVGFVLQRMAIIEAYRERGYVAYGGEWLVLPLMLMVVYVAKQIVRTVKSEWFYDRDSEEV